MVALMRKQFVSWGLKMGPILLGLAFSAALSGRSDRVAAINNFCQAIRQEFAESEPRYFSGPNPWVQLEKQPESFSDLSLATVFSNGVNVSWVILQLSDPDEDWFETANYFFDETGLIQKRERHFEQADANMQVDEVTYFAHGKRIKDSYRHSPLAGGKELLDKLSDPDAPDYLSTADLPILFTPTDSNHLALR